MKILPVNNKPYNTTFEARIKLAKANPEKLIQGTATVSTGAASFLLGLDSWGSGFNSGAVEKIYDSVDHSRSNHFENTTSIALGLFPSIGGLVASNGIEKIIEAKDDSQKNIPD